MSRNQHHRSARRGRSYAVDPTPTRSAAAFAPLLERAVTDPGIISAAYGQFHTYSVSNQLLAWMQCVERDLPLGPLATYARWQALGRQVRRGERAISLCMPVTVRRTGKGSGDDAPLVFTRFVYRPHWFVLAQTDGPDVPAMQIPSWDPEAALAALNVAEIPFEALNGNVMGFARQRSIAISPLNPLPHKTRFHELAHNLLGHTAEGEQLDGESTPRNLREVEAEGVALVCCAALDLPGIDESRGYIQHWWGQGNPIPERTAQRILKVADQILKAGSTTEGVSA